MPKIKTTDDETTDYDDELEAPDPTRPWDDLEEARPRASLQAKTAASVLLEAKSGGWDRNKGNAENLRRWYLEGADGQIPWGAPGDWRACVAVASKHMTLGDAQGYCQLRHHEATGMWTGDREHLAAEGKSAQTGNGPDSFIPPKGVQAAAKRGLELRKKFGRGGTEVGVARARDLSSGGGVSMSTLRRMHSYFSRHDGDKSGKGWGSTSDPSAGYIAWLLWGGDAGKTWAASKTQTETKAAGQSGDDQPDFSDGVMVAVYPDHDALTGVTEHMATTDAGMPAEELHVTLAYLGKVGDDIDDAQTLTEKVQAAAQPYGTLSGQLAGLGRFPDAGDGAVTWAPVDVPGLSALREAIVAALGDQVINNHGFTPHMTLGYGLTDDVRPLDPIPVRFATVSVVYGTDRFDITLGDPEAAPVHVDTATAAAELETKGMSAAERRAKPTLPGEGDRFPIGNTEDLKNAISDFGRAKDADKARVKRWIIRRARELDAVGVLPESWNVTEKKDQAMDTKAYSQMRGSYEERRQAIGTAATDLMKVVLNVDDDEVIDAWPVATYDAEVVVRVWTKGAGEQTYLIPYAIDPDSDGTGVDLGEPVQVQLSLVAEPTDSELSEDDTADGPGDEAMMLTVEPLIAHLASLERKTAETVLDRLAELGWETKSTMRTPINSGRETDPAEAAADATGTDPDEDDAYTRENLPAEGWSRFKKVAPIEAMPMDKPFSVHTREGKVSCERGWLAKDSEGYPYPIADDEMSKVYRPADVVDGVTVPEDQDAADLADDPDADDPDSYAQESDYDDDAEPVDADSPDDDPAAGDAGEGGDETMTVNPADLPTEDSPEPAPEPDAAADPGAETSAEDDGDDEDEPAEPAEPSDDDLAAIEDEPDLDDDDTYSDDDDDSEDGPVTVNPDDHFATLDELHRDDDED